MTEVMGQALVAAREETDQADRRRWIVLTVVLVGSFMAVLDASIMNVAIPSIRADLNATFGEIELVVASYLLVYAVLLITGGRLGDLYGRKNLFMAGMGLFTLASAVCGLAPSASMLIAARALQGVGGALAFPQVLAIMQLTFTGSERTRALAWFGCVISAGAIVGQVLGGLLISANILGLSWRPTFLINVPIGVVGLAAAAIVLDEDDNRSESDLDFVGVLLVSASLLLLFVPLVEGREAGWPAWTFVSLLLSPLSFAAFGLWERRRARGDRIPLLDLRLFSERAFSVGLGMAVTFFGGNAGFAFIFALYLQVGRGFSPIEAALTYVPVAAGFFLTSLSAPRLVPLFGRHVLSLGFGLAAFGYLSAAAVVSAAGPTLSPLELAPALLMVGLGQGLGVTPLVGTVLSGIQPRDAGAASGAMSTVLQIGQVTGVTLLALTFFAIAGQPQPESTPLQYGSAFAGTLPLSGGLALVAAVLVRFLPTNRMETANALIERVPSWAAGLAYSMYLTTGGRLGDQLFHDILGQTVERRTRRTLEAPEPFGDFLAYHYEKAAEDGAWLNFLVREGLTAGEGPIPHEEDRQPVIQRQVDEIRRRQGEGLVPADLDPALLRVMAFALSSYPRVLPQITRMATGLPPSDARFQASWAAFLREIGRRLQPAGAEGEVERRAAARTP